MLPLIGYLDRFSGRPGESLAVKVSAIFMAVFSLLEPGGFRTQISSVEVAS